jgi:hypothetical protein
MVGSLARRELTYRWYGTRAESKKCQYIVSKHSPILSCHNFKPFFILTINQETLIFLISKRTAVALHKLHVLDKTKYVIKAWTLHYLSDDTIITAVGLVSSFCSLLDFVGKSTVDPSEEMTAPQSMDNRALWISAQDIMISTGANNNTVEPPKFRILKYMERI